MDFIYYFGEERFEYAPNWKEIHEFLIPVLVKALKKTKAEVEEMLEDDEFYENCLDYYHENLLDYFEDDAENSYKESQSSYDGFDSYNDFCRYRNPNL